LDILLGILYGFIAQIITFLQLQGNIKYGWYQKYPVTVLAVAIPISWLFIKSVEHLVTAYNGEIWPSRLIGFAVGIIVFGLMSYFLFGEAITHKTTVCLLLAATILGIQIFWK
jgi:hypothetical protein